MRRLFRLRKAARRKTLRFSGCLDGFVDFRNKSEFLFLGFCPAKSCGTRPLCGLAGKSKEECELSDRRVAGFGK